VFRFPANFWVPYLAGTNFGTNLSLMPGARRFPAPGVYKTEPYACIVVVPGRHADEAMMIDPGKTHSGMPIIEPKLKFVPWPEGR
jgi:hypothetical protein